MLGEVVAVAVQECNVLSAKMLSAELVNAKMLSVEISANCKVLKR